MSEGEVSKSEEEKPRKIEKIFDYEEDIEELGKKLDRKNRKELSKEECDSLYLAQTDILEDINSLRSEDKQDFTEHIENIKKEALEQEGAFGSEEFDIFGGMIEDKTKINTLGNTKHREIMKSKFRILDINKWTESNQYIESLSKISECLEKAIDKAKLGVKLSVFLGTTGTLNNQKYSILYINTQDALNMSIDESDKINLYNIKLKEETKAIALTNIVYYENRNKTLPVGMDISDKVLVDMSKIRLEPKKQKLFRINQEINEIEVKTKIVCVYEYEVMEE